ncbi:hypothetical protein [Rhizobium phaseoli]|uniref:DUF4142 domain-containing protein n=1 Tax=Rhizobium phaseoli TaxID=396 RepID=A0ABM6C8W4_9HYPH|nr:hypothetical protein [Rhizobium phaseoli]ANL84616.1 hypothetical protein AMC81_CH01835 [Rhizobium phaseoli]ANL91123.1 hypothetical protein AMC80_CH01835 [Rhizobium phaseoli]
MKGILYAASIIAGITVAVAPANAWNIICGVSINLQASDNNRKWDADSSALYGVSHFYAAVAEMQRLQLRDDKTFANPPSQRSDKTAIEQAAIELKNSSDAFGRSLKLAQAYNLGDEKGLALLKRLSEGVTKLYETIEFDRALPTLSSLQAVAKDINEFTAYGIELSNKHLGMKMPGHGSGGSDYKIPD